MSERRWTAWHVYGCACQTAGIFWRGHDCPPLSLVKLTGIHFQNGGACPCWSMVPPYIWPILDMTAGLLPRKGFGTCSYPREPSARSKSFTRYLLLLPHYVVHVLQLLAVGFRNGRGHTSFVLLHSGEDHNREISMSVSNLKQNAKKSMLSMMVYMVEGCT